MEDVNTFKQEALAGMKDTIEEFKLLSEQGEEQIKKLEKGNTVSNSIQIEVE